MTSNGTCQEPEEEATAAELRKVVEVQEWIETVMVVMFMVEMLEGVWEGVKMVVEVSREVEVREKVEPEMQAQEV